MCLPVESLPVGYCAGSILREAVHAERDQPPFDRVTMDGIALSCAAWQAGTRSFRIAGMQPAGAAPLRLTVPHDCIEVMTGAMLPDGCDAVVPVESLEIAAGHATLAATVAPQPYEYVHRRGSDCTAGAALLQAGLRLEAPDIAIAAGAGLARLRVSQRPAIMVVSTGDELVEPGEPIEPWQLRRSNAYGVTAALRRRGFSRVADDHLPDDAAVLRERLALHLDTHEVLILSGGVSMGKLDLIPGVLRELGVQQVLHRVAQRPGKPLWFGTRGGVAVFALPGNPVSTLACLTRYVFPALDLAMGANTPPGEQVALEAAVRTAPGLATLLPVRVRCDAQGRSWATPVAPNGSGDHAALARTEGLVELPAGAAEYPRGYSARLYRW